MAHRYTAKPRQNNLTMPRQRLADQVYDQIMEAIHGGTISTTDRTVQEKLAEEFGISRTPVREALFRVEQESILEVAGRGSFKIATMSSDEVKEVYETRCAVEAFAARLLAQRNDNATCDKLREIIAQAEELENKATKAYFQANRTVHRSIVEASNNRFLLEFIDNLWNRGSSFALFATLEETSLEKSLGDHMALIDAIETGNDSLAAERMIAHISDGYHLQVNGGRLEG